MTAQSHDYSERPFGAWDTTTGDDMDEREAAITRLMRPSVGATSRAQAEVLVDEIGVDVIRSESDELLAEKVANPSSLVAAPDQAVIAEVLAEVGGDPVKAQVALDAERAGKARVTLIAALEGKLSTPVADADGESVADAGVEATPQGGQGGVPNDVTPGPGDDGAQVTDAESAARETAEAGPHVEEEPNPA